MRVMKRWGVMTLVALLVLGSMGAALADDTGEVEDSVEPIEPGTYEYEWVEDLVTFVFYWGLEGEDKPKCEPAESTGGGGMFGFPLDPGLEEPVEDCHVLDVAGPNGQVNHGTMVSSFVHWLKGADLSGLEGYEDMPKGQMVKELAHLDFGKGFYEFDDLDGDDPELAEEDGHGPPDHAKKAEKAKGKKK